MADEPTPINVANRAATGSLIYALLTVLSFCVGLAPIPFSSLVCYPVSLILALLAVSTGVTGLRQIRRGGGTGRGLAWAGISLGGLAILGVLAAAILAALAALFYPTALAFFQHYWYQIR